ncbi:MAG: VOC family protein [Chitinophagales bacterium]
MLTDIVPKLPMRDKIQTRAFYTEKLGFRDIGSADYPAYLILQKEQVELQFFIFEGLVPADNYGQVYIRVQDIDVLYQDFLDNQVLIHPSGNLQNKPWGQREFSLLDPDNNLLTFGQAL